MIVSERVSAFKGSKFLGGSLMVHVWEGRILGYMAEFPTSSEQIFKLLVN